MYECFTRIEITNLFRQGEIVAYTAAIRANILNKIKFKTSSNRFCWVVFTQTVPDIVKDIRLLLEMLSGFEEGFFLMAEGGRIDHAAHDNDLERMVYETIEFSDAVEAAVAWAEERTDTLIIVTADHETGGLLVESNKGMDVMPSVSWLPGGGHTGVNVPLYATGLLAGAFQDTMENTKIFDILKIFLED